VKEELWWKEEKIQSNYNKIGGDSKEKREDGKECQQAEKEEEESKWVYKPLYFFLSTLFCFYTLFSLVLYFVFFTFTLPFVRCFFFTGIKPSPRLNVLGTFTFELSAPSTFTLFLHFILPEWSLINVTPCILKLN
jgi:hypothetical protein